MNRYRPKKLGKKPDTLTRRSGDLLQEVDKRLVFQDQLLLWPEQLINLTILIAVAMMTPNLSIKTQLQIVCKSDVYLQKIIQEQRKPAEYLKDVTLDVCEGKDRLVYQNRFI